jgi:hypothetical protein
MMEVYDVDVTWAIRGREDSTAGCATAGARSLVAVVFLDGMQDQIADAQETLLLAKSPIFKRLVKRGLAEIQQGQTRPVQELLDELPG